MRLSKLSDGPLQKKTLLLDPQDRSAKRSLWGEVYPSRSYKHAANLQNISTDKIKELVE